jgi:serine/threonine protein phosphatase 1
MRTLVIGDIHGNMRALEQVWDSANIKPEDHVILVGDVCDGWYHTYDVIEFLLQHEKLTFVIGNHDIWLREWLDTGAVSPTWIKNGGQATIDSYRHASVATKEKHFAFLDSAVRYYVHNKDTLIVHGGLNPQVPVYLQKLDVLTWNRDLWQMAEAASPCKLDSNTDASRVIIGHTNIGGVWALPETRGYVTNIDTGAGTVGPLTCLDLDNDKVYQSSPAILCNSRKDITRRGYNFLFDLYIPHLR